MVCSCSPHRSCQVLTPPNRQTTIVNLEECYKLSYQSFTTLMFSKNGDNRKSMEIQIELNIMLEISSPGRFTPTTFVNSIFPLPKETPWYGWKGITFFEDNA